MEIIISVVMMRKKVVYMLVVWLMLVMIGMVNSVFSMLNVIRIGWWLMWLDSLFMIGCSIVNSSSVVLDISVVVFFDSFIVLVRNFCM